MHADIERALTSWSAEDMFKSKGRLGPGKMVAIDLHTGEETSKQEKENQID